MHYLKGWSTELQKLHYICTRYKQVGLSAHLNERNSVQCNDWNIIHRIGSRESLTQSTPVTCYITVMLQRESPWFLCDWNCRVISAYTQWMNGYIYIQWMWQWKYTVNQSIYSFTVLNRNFFSVWIGTDFI